MPKKLFVLAVLVYVIWAVGQTWAQANPVTALSSHKTAMVIILEENEQQSYSVTWSVLFRSLAKLLGLPTDLIDMNDQLKNMINGVPGVKDFVDGLIRQGVLAMADQIIENAKADLGGSIQSCLAELLHQLAQEGLVYGPDVGKAFFNRYGEEAVANCLRDMAAPNYDKVVVLTDHAATFASFKQTLEDLNSQGYLIDLYVDLHSCGTPSTMNNLECGNPRFAFADRDYAPDEMRTINGGQAMNLNAVYMVGCWGGSNFNPVWRDLGARASNGPQELNFYVLLSPLLFMHYFTKGGMTLDDAAKKAYDAERVLFNGKSYQIVIDLRWVPPCGGCKWTFDLNLKYGSLMNQWLSHINDFEYGKDRTKPVNNVASSKRVTAGDGTIRRAELAPPPVVPTAPPPLHIDSLSPTSGGPGQEVTVHGAGFRSASPFPLTPPASQVLFDGHALTTQFVSSTELHFTVPADAACGPHDVQVRNPTFAKGRIAHLHVMRTASGVRRHGEL